MPNRKDEQFSMDMLVVDTLLRVKNKLSTHYSFPSINSPTFSLPSQSPSPFDDTTLGIQERERLGAEVLKDYVQVLYKAKQILFHSYPHYPRQNLPNMAEMGSIIEFLGLLARGRVSATLVDHDILSTVIKSTLIEHNTTYHHVPTRHGAIVNPFMIKKWKRTQNQNGQDEQNGQNSDQNDQNGRRVVTKPILKDAPRVVITALTQDQSMSPLTRLIAPNLVVGGGGCDDVLTKTTSTTILNHYPPQLHSLLASAIQYLRPNWVSVDEFNGMGFDGDNNRNSTTPTTTNNNYNSTPTTSRLNHPSPRLPTDQLTDLLSTISLHRHTQILTTATRRLGLPTRPQMCFFPKRDTEHTLSLKSLLEKFFYRSHTQNPFNPSLSLTSSTGLNNNYHPRHLMTMGETTRDFLITKISQIYPTLTSLLPPTPYLTDYFKFHSGEFVCDGRSKDLEGFHMEVSRHRKREQIYSKMRQDASGTGQSGQNMSQTGQNLSGQRLTTNQPARSSVSHSHQRQHSVDELNMTTTTVNSDGLNITGLSDQSLSSWASSSGQLSTIRQSSQWLYPYELGMSPDIYYCISTWLKLQKYQYEVTMKKRNQQSPNPTSPSTQSPTTYSSASSPHGPNPTANTSPSPALDLAHSNGVLSQLELDLIPITEAEVMECYTRIITYITTDIYSMCNQIEFQYDPKKRTLVGTTLPEKTGPESVLYQFYPKNNTIRPKIAPFWQGFGLIPEYATTSPLSTCTMHQHALKAKIPTGQGRGGQTRNPSGQSLSLSQNGSKNLSNPTPIIESTPNPISIPMIEQVFTSPTPDVMKYNHFTNLKMLKELSNQDLLSSPFQTSSISPLTATNPYPKTPNTYILFTDPERSAPRQGQGMNQGHNNGQNGQNNGQNDPKLNFLAPLQLSTLTSPFNLESVRLSPFHPAKLDQYIADLKLEFPFDQLPNGFDGYIEPHLPNYHQSLPQSIISIWPLLIRSLAQHNFLRNPNLAPRELHPRQVLAHYCKEAHVDLCFEISAKAHQFSHYCSNVMLNRRQETLNISHKLSPSHTDIKFFVELLIQMGLFGSGNVLDHVRLQRQQQLAPKNGQNGSNSNQTLLIPKPIQDVVNWAHHLYSDGNSGDVKSNSNGANMMNLYSNLSCEDFIDDFVSLLAPFTTNPLIISSTTTTESPLIIPGRGGALMKLPAEVVKWLKEEFSTRGGSHAESQSGQNSAQTTPGFIHDHPFIKSLSIAIQVVMGNISIQGLKPRDLEVKNSDLAAADQSTTATTTATSATTTTKTATIAPQQQPKIVHCNCPSCSPPIPTIFLQSPIFQPLYQLMIKSMVAVAVVNEKLKYLNLLTKSLFQFKQHHINSITSPQSNISSKSNPFQSFAKLGKQHQHQQMQGQQGPSSSSLPPQPQHTIDSLLSNTTKSFSVDMPDLDYAYIPTHINKTTYQNDQNDDHNHRYTINRYASIFPQITNPYHHSNQSNQQFMNNGSGSGSRVISTRDILRKMNVEITLESFEILPLPQRPPQQQQQSQQRPPQQQQQHHQQQQRPQ